MINFLPSFFISSAPLNAQAFRSTGRDETSITLQWNKVNNNVSFTLQYNGTETNIDAPHGDGPVAHTVSSLTAGTQYTFTLFSVFENIRSRGVNITAVTGKIFNWYDLSKPLSASQCNSINYLTIFPLKNSFYTVIFNIKQYYNWLKNHKYL